MTTVLGLNFGHDGAVALIRDGRLVAALAKERLTRNKKEMGVSSELIQRVLALGNTKLDEVQAIAFASFVYHPGNTLQVFEPGGAEIKRHVFDLPSGVTHTQLEVRIDALKIPGIFVQHHLAHCASAFYTSDFDKAACLSADASHFRPEACSLTAYGQGNKLHYFHCPGIMVGNLYDRFTDKLGIGPGLFKAGSLMGLAAYGSPLPSALAVRELVSASWYEREFQENDPVFIDYIWSRITGRAPHSGFPREESDSGEAMNVAASVQYLFEETMVKYVAKLHAETTGFNGNKLCLSGGSFLNADCNMRILREGPFSEVHLFPACGDDGTAVGAALYTAHHLLNAPRVSYQPSDLAYLGGAYPTSPELGSAVDINEVAARIAKGQVVGWVQGRSEFGPRALGNRSILADPRSSTMRDHINHEVKCREWYRPFAPVVLEEAARDWFEIDRASKYMLYIARALQPELVPAISHVDRTARLQTVARNDNAKLYELIEAFAGLTGVPMLLNTSFNGNGEPLAETPEDAMRFFESGKLDCLVLGDRMVSRDTNAVEKGEILAVSRL